MLAPSSEITRSKAASASGICSALAWISGKCSPKRSCKAAAVAAARRRCPGRLGGALRRADHAEISPVPAAKLQAVGPAGPAAEAQLCLRDLPHSQAD